MADIELLERLCCARGISGFEEAVREIILKEIRPYADCVEITPLGNILAFKKGKRRAKTKPVSYTHLDVYKRQIAAFLRFIPPQRYV